jgi:hypothetical protein
MPAQWTTASQPANAALSASTSVMSARTTLAWSGVSEASLGRVLAMLTTSWPSRVSRSATCLPTKPLPPVIATFTVFIRNMLPHSIKKQPT